MAKQNVAEELVGMAQLQLAQSYQFKLPRISRIRQFRDLYNGKAEAQKRVRYNVPIPIFSGMIDTLQADLDDDMILEYHEDEPADWKAAKKANAALKKEMTSMRPGAMWSQKMRSARQEMLFTGRGFLKFLASNEDGFQSNLYAPTFDDMYFEPKGGGQLENHLFVGQSDIWKTKKDLENEAGGIYSAKQVKELAGGWEYKMSTAWNNYDFANRFQSLNLSSESNNYVCEPMFNLVEWGLTYKGNRWYLLFEAFSGTWLRCEKLTDVFSSGYWPWMSFASHEDSKNFASKGFSDDLYPQAKIMTDFFNEDLENRRRVNSGARAYDKDMFPNVAQLDEAMLGRDRLVEVDTKGGARRIDQGLYQFTTPLISGTIDVLKYMEDMVGRNIGVTDLQQGEMQGQNKKVGVTYAELSQVSKRLSFQSQPFIEVGQQLGMRFFNGLKDYLREPLSIKLLGENGYEWDTMKRIDLNIKKEFEISVASKSKENKMNELARVKKMNALVTVRNTPPANPGVNARMIDEYLLRDADLDESEIALILDPQSHANKETIAETSEAIQDIMMGITPKLNYNASAYFLQTILDFVKTHQDDKKINKKLPEFMAYLAQHEQIAIENETRRAKKDAMTMTMGTMPAQSPGSAPVGPAMPRMSPVPPPAAGAPPMPPMTPPPQSPIPAMA